FLTLYISFRYSFQLIDQTATSVLLSRYSFFLYSDHEINRHILLFRCNFRLAVKPRDNFCLSSYSGIAFVLRSNQETTFAYPLTHAQPSSCGQTKKQLLLILLLRHSLRLAVKPRNNFCLSSYSGIAF